VLPLTLVKICDQDRAVAGCWRWGPVRSDHSAEWPPGPGLVAVGIPDGVCVGAVPGSKSISSHAAISAVAGPGARGRDEFGGLSGIRSTSATVGAWNWFEPICQLLPAPRGRLNRVVGSAIAGQRPGGHGEQGRVLLTVVAICRW